MRTVTPLDEVTASQFPDNLVVNSRYTLLTFLPCNLFEQFRKPLNFYFLLVAMLQFISIIAPVNPLSTLLPLTFAFMLTAIKEGYDDIKRHRQDRIYNNKQYLALDPANKQSWKKIASHQIRVGDVLKIRNDEAVPCDVVVVACPESSEGTILIRTDNLDGEIDLKPRDVVPIARDLNSSSPTCVPLSSAASLQELLTYLEGISFSCPPPSAVMDAFDARRCIELNTGARDVFPMTSQHLVPQSCYLKHTSEAICVVVYTGNETKCGMNKHSPRPKWAQIDQTVSSYSKAIFGFQILTALTMGVIALYKNTIAVQGMWYLGNYSEDSVIIFQLRFFLLTTVMIPVSFKFVVDLSKQYMAQVLEWDLAMYNDENGEGVKVRNSSIVEDLGQVEYVLSDKTGTMTQNKMELRSIFVAGEVFQLNQVSAAVQESKVSAALDNFLVCALLNNSVDVVEDKDKMTLYLSPSPDEEAICNGIRAFRYEIRNRNKSHVSISANGVERNYRVLRVFPFTSEKKCMGIIVQRSTGDVTTSPPILLVKGADDKILSFPRTRESTGVLDSTIQQLSAATTSFSQQGLRTLLLASKTLTAVEYAAFDREYQVALSAMLGRQALCDQLELSLMTNIDILGITAIEDTLQKDVLPTIRSLRDANIRVWMLTGDKLETAEQISLSCGLQTPTDHVIRITENSSGREDWRAELRDAAAKLPPNSLSSKLHRYMVRRCNDDAFDRAVQLYQQHKTNPEHHPPHVLIVQGGQVLDEILNSTDGSLTHFTNLSMQATSVVCARVTPSQKAQVTKLVSSVGYVTLAVGDGGNDVAMIQQAHVGVGICGKEGSQASRAADFSISQFSHLRSLVLYHGQISYARTAYVVQYSFYKSMLISFIQLIFNAVCTFMSGASFWNSFSLTMWNGVYTLPQTLCYCLDRAAPRRALELNPSVYRHSQKSGDFNSVTFFGFVVRGILQSLALFWLSTSFTEDTIPGKQHGASHDVTFTLAYSGLILHQAATVILESNSLTLINVLVIVGMPVFYFLTMMAYSAIPRLAFYGVFQQTESIQGFLIAFGIAGALFAPHVLFSALKHFWAPNPRVAVAQWWKASRSAPITPSSRLLSRNDEPLTWRRSGVDMCGSCGVLPAVEPASLYCSRTAECGMDII